MWAPKGHRPIALGHHRYKWLYVTAFVQPISGETVWYVSNGISKPFFAGLLALFAREAGAGRERMIALVLDNAGWHTAPNLVVAEASLALCERGEVFHLADVHGWGSALSDG